MNINLSDVYENILLKYHHLIKLNDDDLIYYISDYDKINYYNQYDTKTCLSIVLNYLINHYSFSIKSIKSINLKHIENYDPFILYNNSIDLMKSNNDYNTNNGTNLYYLLNAFNNIKPNNDIPKIQTKLHLVKPNWNIIRYYLINNIPIGITLNMDLLLRPRLDPTLDPTLTSNQDIINYHSVVIFGFNNKNKSIYVGPFVTKSLVNTNDKYINLCPKNFIEIKFELFILLYHTMFIIK